MSERSGSEMFATLEALVMAVMRAIPYSDQISKLDFSEVNAIRFDWRGSGYRVSKSGHVEEVKGSVLSGSNLAILMGELIERQWASDMARIEDAKRASSIEMTHTETSLR